MVGESYTVRSQGLEAETMALWLLGPRVSSKEISINGKGFVFLSSQETENFTIINSEK